LSALSPEQLADVLCPLEKFIPHTIVEIPELLSELDNVRKQGFAIDNEESFAGIRCVAAPIKNSKGRIVAAISATVPKQRMNYRRMEEIRKQVIETARLISKHAGAEDAIQE